MEKEGVVRNPPLSGDLDQYGESGRASRGCLIGNAAMEALLYVYYHPLHVIVFFSFIATALAAIAWGRSGAISALVLAPSWGAAFAVAGLLLNKPTNVTLDHLNVLEVVRVFLTGTAVWMVAAIPGSLMGLAIRALIKGHPKSKPPA
jgi:hypothetical protein